MVTLATALHPPEKVNTRHRDTQTTKETHRERKEREKERQRHTQREKTERT